jgi:hypothetical protein
MEGSLDPFDFMLAERLGWRSVREMRAGMSHAEYVEWRALHKVRRELAKFEEDKAATRARARAARPKGRRR